MKISIIVPFFNTDEMLYTTCINSILQQTFKDFEVIIVDDGSKKNISDKLEKNYCGNKKIKLVHTPNNGVSEARNIGIKESTGNMICFIDSDDYIAPWMLEDLWNAYSEVSGVQAVCAYYKMTDRDSMPFKRNRKSVKIATSLELKKTALIGMNCRENENGYLSAGPVAVLFSRDIAKKILFKKNIKYMEDVLWNYEFFEKIDRVAILNETVYAYRVNSTSATHKYNLDIVNYRLSALYELKKIVCDDEMKQWFALRVLSNYVNCCKCCMREEENSNILKKIYNMYRINQNTIWNDFKSFKISKSWDSKQKMKQILAIWGLLPIIYYFKRDSR